MTYEQLLASIQAWAGLTDEAQTRAVTTAVTRTLSEMIAPSAIPDVITQLPRELADELRRPATAARFAQDEFFERVASDEGTHEGFAREHAPVVVHAIVDSLDGTGRQQLTAALPPWLVERMNHIVEHTPAPTRPGHHLRTLAGGSGGSAHPVATSKAERAQRHSIASNPDPHGDTKLATGVVHPEDPVAESPPGSKHPLVD